MKRDTDKSGSGNAPAAGLVVSGDAVPNCALCIVHSALYFPFSLAFQAGEIYNKKKMVEDGNMKRADYISWDEYFMGIAMLAARRSKDPNTQVGACIVSQDNIIISTGYNGMPKGCSDDEYPWEREGDNTKYPYVVHAELNAVLNANGRDLRGSKLYVALFPCNECAKAIIQSGVKEVFYLSDKYADSMATLASKRMLDSAGVKYTQLRTELKSITLDFVPEEERK